MNKFGPYTPIVKVGDMYFVSGQVGVDPVTKACHPDVASQTKQALTNLSEVLASEGLSLKDVVKTTIFLTGMSDFQIVNEEYVKNFHEPRPARSTVAVAELPRVANHPILIEIEAVAWKPDQ